MKNRPRFIEMAAKPPKKLDDFVLLAADYHNSFGISFGNYRLTLTNRLQLSRGLWAPICKSFGAVSFFFSSGASRFWGVLLQASLFNGGEAADPGHPILANGANPAPHFIATLQ